jgi:hypothetical protein
MRRFCRAAVTAALALAFAAISQPGPARAETEVDLALVLAVDISFSMDPEEQTLQRQGFVEAFRSVLVQDAIRQGMIGRIAVTYMEWAGAGDQRVVVPWTLIDTHDTADAFSAALSVQPTRRAARTSISGALDFAAKLLAEAPFRATRQVIDVSGDGPNNQGRPVVAARSDALARGVTINGLPLMLKSAGYFDIPDLDLYYRDCVIGGQGAFMVPVRDREQFRDAVKTKIIMEVAGDARPSRFGSRIPRPIQPVTSVVPAQTEESSGRCLAGEVQWRDRMGN